MGSLFYSCEFDCDCPAGYSCTRLESEFPYTCQIPCRGSGDCPESLTCYAGDGALSNAIVCRDDAL